MPRLFQQAFPTMLEQLRQSSKSFIIWILFGIIILVFIISFGPQANQQIGCGASKSSVMVVNDQEVDQSSWRFAVNGLPQLLPQMLRGRDKQGRDYIALDLLLARELLAQAGEDAGFRVSDSLAEDQVKKGEWFFLGYPAGKSWFFVDGFFNYDRLERHAQGLGLTSVNQFIKQQKRELLAESMRSLIISGVNVSRDEVLADFTHQHTTATIQYVRFSSAAYSIPNPSDAQITAYLADHEADVKAKYDAEAVNYKDTKPSVKLREIFIDKGDDDAAAEAKAKDALAKIDAGGDFAALATELSDDKATAARGGLVGWRRLDRPGLPDPKLSDALAKIEPGKHSGVVDTKRGFYILGVDAKREGDLGFDQVKMEIARGMAVQAMAKEAAKADADAARAELGKNGKLADLFEAAPARPQFDPNQLPEGITPEQLEQLIKQQAQKGEKGKTGSIIVTGDAIPAEWTTQGGDDAAAAGGAASTPATPKPAKPTPAKATPADKAAPAKAKPADKAAPAKAKPADKAGSPEPDKNLFHSPDDGLPRPASLKMPKIQNQGPFVRDVKTIPGLGESKQAMQAIFEGLEIGQVAPGVFEIGNDYVIIELAAQTDPDLDQFTKDEPQLLQQARLEKANDVLGQWLKDRCTEVAKGGHIQVNQTMLQVTNDQGQTVPGSYKPCQFF